MTKKYKLVFNVTLTINADDDTEQERIIAIVGQEFRQHARTMIVDATKYGDGTDTDIEVTNTEIDNAAFSSTIRAGRGYSVYPLAPMSFDATIKRWNNNWKIVGDDNPNWSEIQNVKPMLQRYENSFYERWLMPDLDKDKLLPIWGRYITAVNNKVEMFKSQELQRIVAENMEGEYEDGLLDEGVVYSEPDHWYHDELIRI